ncbi:MAG TPA: type IV pilus modification protein PilV [Burkholderiaceae bacterium]|nr:type IV pilus modification protein PilV [Burkholderiaceae bacterium]
MKHHPARQDGFTLIEALIALLVVAFGILALAGLQMTLYRNSDVARQRGEATRLAQEQMETLRSFTQINAASGVAAWDSLANGTNNVSNNTSATYARIWTLGGTSADVFRTARVSVSWTDRANESQAVTLDSVISKSDPSDGGALGFPLPDNTTLKRPKNRNLNIPIPAIDLNNGKSAYQIANNFAIIFSNDSGYVVQKCPFTVSQSSDLSTCTTFNAYILAGYISYSTQSDGSVSAFPTGLSPGISTGGLTGWNTSSPDGITCTIGNASDQNNTSSTITGYKYYLCVVPVNTNGAWSGTVRLTGMSTGTNYLVCRFQYPTSSTTTANQRNVQPYASVAESLDNQNYLISTRGNCPTVQSLATTLHQSCTGSSSQRATECPAS